MVQPAGMGGVCKEVLPITLSPDTPLYLHVVEHDVVHPTPLVDCNRHGGLVSVSSELFFQPRHGKRGAVRFLKPNPIVSCLRAMHLEQWHHAHWLVALVSSP